jgi:hypothetical protein
MLVFRKTESGKGAWEPARWRTVCPPRTSPESAGPARGGLFREHQPIDSLKEIADR